jgi:hypothetical protein
VPFHLVPARDRKLFRLVKRAEDPRLVKGRPLYAAGSSAKNVFLVKSGFMRLVLPGMEKGRSERTVSVALPWELFGDEAVHQTMSEEQGTLCFCTEVNQSVNSQHCSGLGIRE